MADKVIIYSDGGSDPNPGIGGWAAILRSGPHEKVLTGSDPDTTNNRMELQAAIEALRALKRPGVVEFHTDSEYVRRGITEHLALWKERGWKTKAGQPVRNVELWQELEQLTVGHEIEWRWVKGHSGDQYNERVDLLARQARLAITPEVKLDENIPRLFLRSSCKGNPGPGGWAVVLEARDRDEQMSGSAGETTNNRMEITAAIEGILMLQPGSNAAVFTTSDYLFQGITRWIHGWRKRDWKKRDGQPVANMDLWQALDSLTDNYAVHWVNAKGQDLGGLAIAGQLAAEAARLN